ncbi:ribosomal-processing cysteine protease Prp [Exiguobacterium flavidum]|uniref:ribosomal-processing cysteine protease Prp n=1 Tax=Exiguobacterium flavidum TaxID=2184695 RepID=UPI000DF77B6C|nr:ribosomal-processing cysteine protease Prp [Exiguobacterium flavidum]
MIRVKVRRDEAHVRSVEVTGHAEFAEPGSDLVCAGASAVIFGAYNAMESLLGQVLLLEMADKREGGYFYVEPYADLAPEVSERTQLLLEAMLVQLATIAESYGDYIQLEQV